MFIPASLFYTIMLQRRLIVFGFIFAFTFSAFAQTPRVWTDTSAIQLYVPPLPFEKSDLSFPSSLNLITADYSPEYLRASLTAPPSLTEKATQEIQGIWQRELKIQNEGKTWKAILGSLEMGGAAYILYEHVHKYGLK